MPYAIKTKDAIHHVMSKTRRGEVLDSYQITDLIRKNFGKNEKQQTVGRQLRRMTNEEGMYNPWLQRIDENKYIFVDNPCSLYAVLERAESSKMDLKKVSDKELLDEIKKRLKR